MKNKQNEANGYNCVKCETGETETHGSECSCNKVFTEEDICSLLKGLNLLVEYQSDSIDHTKLYKKLQNY